MGEKRRAVGSILRKLCEWKNVRILEAECCADHIHMLLEIPPKMSVSGFMGYLKGKSSLMLYEAVWGFEIQIQEQGVLVPRILR
ncbi:transposase for IS200 [Salmonella bongori]|nr:transposase for IS200 [Salmonella bongori]